MPEDVYPRSASTDDLASYFTLGMCLNYQRNSYALWRACTSMFEDPTTRWAFDMDAVGRASLESRERPFCFTRSPYSLTDIRVSRCGRRTSLGRVEQRPPFRFSYHRWIRGPRHPHGSDAQGPEIRLIKRRPLSTPACPNPPGRVRHVADRPATSWGRKDALIG